MRVVLLGLKGAGKTTVGRELAGAFGWKFFDTDLLIEEKVGMSVREFFLEVGEEGFRGVEYEVLLGCFQLHECVIATGGGSFLLEKSREVLARLGKLVALYVDREELLERWQSFPPFCSSITEFDRYYEGRMELLRKLPCEWLSNGK